MMRRLTRLVFAFAAVVLLGATSLFASEVSWKITASEDGTPIAYAVSGKGDTTLIFSHGWCCDSRYWENQVPFFSKKYRVITVDLAGHGHSGFGRGVYSMEAFGRDIKAVADAEKVNRAILIGHSMSGIVIAETAALMPERVAGIIGIDTLENVEEPFTQEMLSGYINQFMKDFPATTRSFVGSMFVKGTDPILSAWIIEDMAAAPIQVGISAMNEMMGMYVRGDVAKLFDRLTVPVRCVNADLNPTNAAANRKHMRSFDVKIMKGRGHFLMMESPKEFNKLLQETIKELTSRN